MQGEKIGNSLNIGVLNNELDELKDFKRSFEVGNPSTITKVELMWRSYEKKERVMVGITISLITLGIGNLITLLYLVSKLT